MEQSRVRELLPVKEMRYCAFFSVIDTVPV